MVTSYQIAEGIGYLTQREVTCIKLTVEKLPDNPLCVNIGSGAGTSVISVFEARPDAYIVDVDINSENGISQLSAAGVLDSGRYERITGDSKAVDFYRLCDFLFIDGDHSEEGIRGDLTNWLQYVPQGGYIAAHDYWPYPADHELAGRDYWPAVKVVCDEVLEGVTVVYDADRLRVWQR